MSATEQLLKRFTRLTEADANAALDWIEQQRPPEPKRVSEAELRKMDEALGFARTYRSETRTTAGWMKELREGEEYP